MKQKKAKQGGSSSSITDPSVNSEWCDSLPTQCVDIPFTQCQKGGMDANVNPNWCDGHSSQCMDTYNTCQKGGSLRSTSYYKYKKYKAKYKSLSLNKL